MKVGILTQHFFKNYGGILQNWALQQVLLKFGHDPLTFEHDTCYSRTRWLLRSAKQVLQTCSLKNLPAYPYRGRVGHRAFIDFIITNIRSVTVHGFTPDLERRYACEAFIVGSDQVWRPAFNRGRLYSMYLDFAGDEIRKVAYAASFGVSDWEYSNAETSRCSELAKRFNAISVREDSAIGLCREHLGVQSTWVLDPTLLLDREDYICLCKHIPQEKKILLINALHLTDDIMVFAKDLAQAKGLRIKLLQAGNKLKPEDSIEKWLAAFRDAEAVVTDSFHGMSFSIIFNKPFYIFKNESGGVARYFSLLQLLGLENRIVDRGQALYENIDWATINKNRNDMKRESIHFLKESLS